MPFRRTLIGTGVGAVTGALLGGGLGAASAEKRDERVEQSVRGAIAGGILGGVLGGAIHGGVRAKQLRDLGYYPDLSLTDPLTRGSKVTVDADREFLLRLHAGREARRGTKTVEQMKKENPFLGASPSNAKGVYREFAKQLHPDKPGGSEESFKKLKEQFERFKVWHPGATVTKQASHVFWTSFSSELQKLAAKKPVALKVPKPGTNLKGMERYTGNPGRTPITEPGKENASAASVSGLGRSNDTVGRSSTSANPTPAPPIVS